MKTAETIITKQSEKQTNKQMDLKIPCHSRQE